MVSDVNLLETVLNVLSKLFLLSIIFSKEECHTQDLPAKLLPSGGIATHRAEGTDYKGMLCCPFWVQQNQLQLRQ